MTLKEDIIQKNKEMINDKFCMKNVNFVPSITNNSLTFGAKGLNFDATVLYIDIRNSTVLLNQYKRNVIAKIHMAYYNTIVKIARAFDGEVRSFNGDSLLVFFQSKTKASAHKAVDAAMSMTYMLNRGDDCLSSYLMRKYRTALDFGIGIDVGEILCTKVGIGGENNRDLVWIGNAVNKSVKISDTRKANHNIGISSTVYNMLDDEHKYCKGKNMWKQGCFTYNKTREFYYYTNYHCTL